MSIRDVLTQPGLSLTPSEEKVVRLLLADYPTSGLGTASSLARRASVSDPTVVRLVMKLGYNGFPDFQAKLLAEVEARLHSPLLMMEAKKQGSAEGNRILSYLDSVSEALEKSKTITPPQTYDRVARYVIETKGEIVLVGGRFSRHVSGMLAGYLTQLRPSVRDIGTLSTQAFDTLADLGRRDLLIVFDYRRYQLDVVAYARQAAERGVRVVLFTDQWLSPIAELAEATIVSPLEVASPYDTLAPAIAQIEALVAHILAGMGERARVRIEKLEEVRHANAATLDNNRPNAEKGSPARARKPKAGKKT